MIPARKSTTRLRAVVAGVVGLVALGSISPAHATNIGSQGCTPGYWKNHTRSWQEYSLTTKVGTVWALPASLSQFRSWTFAQALAGGGGSGVTGAAQILLRASVAAYLNAAHEGVGYRYRRFSAPLHLKAQINAALASGDRATMLRVAATLDTANNLGCPLN